MNLIDLQIMTRESFGFPERVNIHYAHISENETKQLRKVARKKKKKSTSQNQ